MKYKGMTIFLSVLTVGICGMVVGICVALKQRTNLEDIKIAVDFTQMAGQGLYHVIIKSLTSNLVWFAAISILGFWRLGSLLCLLVLGYKGYAAGLSAAYLALALGLKGVVMGFVGVLLPAMLLLVLYSFMVLTSLLDKFGGSRLKIVQDSGVAMQTFISIFVFLGCVYFQSLLQYMVFYKF